MWANNGRRRIILIDATDDGQPVGTVRISVWFVPAPMSDATPSVMTMLPSAVKAAPLVELSALSAGILLPPVGDVMVTLAHSRGKLEASNPKINPSRSMDVFILVQEPVYRPG